MKLGQRHRGLGGYRVTSNIELKVKGSYCVGPCLSLPIFVVDPGVVVSFSHSSTVSWASGGQGFTTAARKLSL